MGCTKDQVKKIIETVLPPLLWIIFLLALFVALPAYNYSLVVFLNGAGKNEYIEWQSYYLVVIIVGCIYSLSPIISHIVDRFSRHIGSIIAKVIDASSIISFIILAILGFVLLYVGKSKNTFGDWDEKFMAENNIVSKFEKNFDCRYYDTTIIIVDSVEYEEYSVYIEYSSSDQSSEMPRKQDTAINEKEDVDQIEKRQDEGNIERPLKTK